MSSDFISKQFMIFLVTSGLAAVVNFGSRIVYNQAVDFSTAIILAYLTGMVVAFILNKAFVFKKNTQSLLRSASWFVLVNCVAIIQTWIISVMLVSYILPAFQIKTFIHEIAHFVGISVPAFTSYIGHKYWTFRNVPLNDFI